MPMKQQPAMLALAAFISAGTVTPVQAQDADPLTYLGADRCTPVNFNKGLRTIQQSRGAVVNYSDTEAVAVNCALPPPVDPNSYYVAVFAKNNDQVSTEINCQFRSFTNDNRMQGEQRNRISLGPKGTGNVLMYLIGVPGLFLPRVFTMTCRLPPQTQLNMLAIGSAQTDFI